MALTRRTALAILCGLGVGECDDGPGPWDPGRGNGSDPGRSLPPEGTFPEGCPEYEGVSRVVAFHGIDPAETAIYLEPSADSIGEGQPITFTLSNESVGEFSYNPYRWHLHKRVDGRWYYIAPQEWPEPLAVLESGERDEWELTVGNEGIEDGEPVRYGRDPITGLGGGAYAFGVRGSTREHGSIGFCARFDLETDDLALTSTNAIAETEWDGETLVARSERREPDENARLAAYDLSRTNDDVHGTELITETLLRNDQLRDAIALSRAYDADRVRIREYASGTPVFGQDEAGYYHYDGETYEVSTRVLEE